MSKYFCSLLLLIFFSQYAVAQIDAPLRVELESAKDQQDYSFVSLKENGVAVFYQSAVVSVDTAQWVFIHYDTSLVRTNLFKIKVPNLCNFISTELLHNKLYVLFQKPAHKKDTLRYYLLEWNLNQNNFIFTELLNIKNPYINSFRILPNAIILKAESSKNKSIISYNFSQQTITNLQGQDDEIVAVESFITDTLAQKVFINLFLKNKKGTYADFWEIDKNGVLQKQIPFPFYQDLVYNSASSVVVAKDSVLITGGYTNLKEKKLGGSYSGVYTMLLAKGQIQDISIFPFSTLLSNDTITSKKIAKTNSSNMKTHLQQINGKYFVVTELFSPEYQYNSATRSFGYFGYEPPTEVFAGYRHQHALITQFNKVGQFVFDFYFPINEVLTQTLYPLVKVFQDDENFTLLYYTYHNEVVSQMVQGKNVVAAHSSLPIVAQQKGDIVEYVSSISMRNWYANNFLISGYQYIKNTNSRKGKRYVFFLNKLICE